MIFVKEVKFLVVAPRKWGNRRCSQHHYYMVEWNINACAQIHVKGKR